MSNRGMWWFRYGDWVKLALAALALLILVGFGVFQLVIREAVWYRLACSPEQPAAGEVQMLEEIERQEKVGATAPEGE